MDSWMTLWMALFSHNRLKKLAGSFLLPLLFSYTNVLAQPKLDTLTSRLSFTIKDDISFGYFPQKTSIDVFSANHFNAKFKKNYCADCNDPKFFCIVSCPNGKVVKVEPTRNYQKNKTFKEPKGYIEAVLDSISTKSDITNAYTLEVKVIGGKRFGSSKYLECPKGEQKLKFYLRYLNNKNYIMYQNLGEVKLK